MARALLLLVGVSRLPVCHTIIAYDQFTAANTGAIFSCRNCGLPLVIHRKTDQPVVATKKVVDKTDRERE